MVGRPSPRLLVKRERPRENLENDHSKGPDIALWTEAFVPNLRSDIRWGTSEIFRLFPRLEHFSNPEVDDHRMRLLRRRRQSPARVLQTRAAFGKQHHVLRLQIFVNHLQAVAMRDRLSDLIDDLPHPALVQLPPRFVISRDCFQQFSAFTQVLDNRHILEILIVLVDLDDVRMIQLDEHVDLSLHHLRSHVRILLLQLFHDTKGASALFPR
mmetsp:Transcript_70853/g.162461  ORF Transcript_70853/g.162461 Transcript_70853/m.162461 type:complete len:212 (+) Transcript_70853:814-1449(+)